MQGGSLTLSWITGCDGVAAQGSIRVNIAGAVASCAAHRLSNTVTALL